MIFYLFQQGTKAICITSWLEFELIIKYKKTNQVHKNADEKQSFVPNNIHIVHYLLYSKNH